MQSQLVGSTDAPVLYGPSRLVDELVTLGVRAAIADVHARLQMPRLASEDERRAVLTARAVLNAWIASYVDVQAIQWFGFDADADPLR
jgi:hypothetical protein